MTVPAAPQLPEEYRIGVHPPAVSIDALVEEILSQATASPVLCNASAAELQALLTQQLPETGTSLETVLEELRRTAATHYRRNAHPGCWAYVASAGLPTDPLGHAVTAALNQNVTGFHSAPGATLIERTLVRWMAELAGLPRDSAGLVLSGGSMANLAALAVARDRALGPVALEQGLRAGPQPVILAAETAHFSVRRASQLLGIGRQGLITIPVDEAQRMRVDLLEEHLAGLSGDALQRVCCVVASAGTTATGAVDPLPEIAALCRRHGVWLHVDAAYGGAALLSADLRDRLRGIGEADSITIDLHKWCYLALDGSLLLYRDPQAARVVFQQRADYAALDEGDTDEAYTFFDLSPETSRRSRALAAWLALRHYGLEILGRNLRHNVECAEYLAQLVDAHPALELAAGPQLSTCCFRYVPGELAGQEVILDELNEGIVAELVRRGDFLLSPLRIDGRSVLRVCIRSHTTGAVHVEKLVDEVLAIGRELRDGKAGH